MDLKEGSVTIPVEMFNNLRDFRKTIEENGAVRFKYGWKVTEYLTGNEVIKTLQGVIKVERDEYKKQIEKLKMDKWALERELKQVKAQKGFWSVFKRYN